MGTLMKSLGNEDADSLENICELKYAWSLYLKLDFGEEFLKTFHFLQQTRVKKQRPGMRLHQRELREAASSETVPNIS